MNLLLDTHVLFWWATDDANLPGRFTDLIAANENDVFVSVATCWEIAIKVQTGRWPEARNLFPGVQSFIKSLGFHVLPIACDVAERAAFPDNDHRDPFDRLLAAQALTLDLTFLTVDPVFAQIADLKVV